MTPPTLTPDDLLLIEAATSAFRSLDRDGLSFHPAWHDLAPDGRRAAFDATVKSRRLEAVLDPEGLSSTARAVLGRIGRAG